MKQLNQNNMKQELGYTCPQTKKQCDDECCVSAEDCHAEAINNIISNCEPEQLNQNNMKQDKTWLLLPMLAYSKYSDGAREFAFGWLNQTFFIKF